MPVTTGSSDATMLSPAPYVPSTRALGSNGLRSSPEYNRANGWLRRIDDLLAIRGLGDDWDGLGAEAPRIELVDSAIEIAKALRVDPSWRAPTRVAATPAGAVLFEWQYPPVYLEAEVTGPTHIEWMLEVAGHETQHWESEFESG